MRLGMLIDVDHMSQAAAEKTLELATQYGYSINSGHGGVRVHSNERSLRAYQYAIIGRLHGMAGVGSGGTNSQDWLAAYSRVIQAMGGDTTYPPYREGTVVAGFGTDANSLVLGMPPRPGSPGSALPPSKDGSKTWNYNADGVAHYGMLWDFVADLKTLTNANGDSIGKAMVNNNLMHGADYFFRTWLLSETCGRGMEAPAPTVSGVVPNGSPVGSAVTVTITGRNFLGVRSIILSQGLAVVPVDDFAVNSATQITALIPASLTTGVVNVVVQTCAASSWPTSTVPFFATPVITSVSPTSGPFGGHTLVTVTGAGLNPYIFGGSLGGTKWMVGGTSIEGAPYCTDKACLLSTPPHKPGVADVQACIVPGACSAPTTADRFTYLGPTITSIKPSSGPVAGGTPVDIDGTMLNDVVRPQIFFGGVEASGYLGCATSGYGKSCLEAFSPPAGSPGPVHITAGAFGSLSTVSSADLFTYEPNARLIAIGCCADLWQGWVELNGFAPTGGAVISLTSSDPTAVALAAPTATVPAGNRGSYFNYTFPPTPIAKTATLTARYAGTSVSTTITVSAWPPIQIQFGAWDLGGHNVTATVTLNTPPPPGGGVVSLSSTDTSALSVPASVTVPAKSITGTFTATTNYSGKPKTVYVTATYKGASDKALVLVGELQPRRRPRPQTCAKGYSWNDIDGRCDPGTPQ